MLSPLIPKLPGVFGPGFQFQYLPAASDRAPWAALDASLKETLVRAGVRWSGRAWPTLPASRYLDFYRNGNRDRFEHIYFERRQALMDLVMAESVQGEGRLMTDISDLVWAICEESSWVIPAHNSHNAPAAPRDLPPFDEEPYVDLFAAETGATLALTEVVLAESLDRVSPAFRKRLRHEIKVRIWEPYLNNEAWWWMGLSHKNPVNNWNPWINSNVLVTALALSSRSDERLALVEKILRSTERFVAGYGPDGGCDEGPGYWNAAAASLFDLLDLIAVTSQSAVTVGQDPLLKAMARFPMLTHLDGQWFVNFADAAPRIGLDGALLCRFARMTGDGELEAFARWVLTQPWGANRSHWGHFQRRLANLFHVPPGTAPAEPPRVLDAPFPNLQVLVARENTSNRGFTLAAKGGHNGESHNHNDVGHFTLAFDGEPLLVDAGVGVYTRETFSAARYTIWTMQGAWHNQPVIGGLDQCAGGQHAARDFAITTDGVLSHMSLDVAGAYPAGSGIHSWVRRFTLDRNKGEVWVDELWKLSPERAAAGSEIHLLCRPKPTAVSTGVQFALTDHKVIFLEVPPIWQIVIEEKIIDDPNLKSHWGDRLYRVTLSAAALPESGQCRFVFRQTGPIPGGVKT